MNYNKKIILISVALIIQTICNNGCSKLYKNIKHSDSNHKGTANNYITNNYKTTLGTEIEEQLVASARSIEKSLAALAANQETSNISILNTAPLLTPEGGMGGTADIDWTGPIEPLLEKIANMTDYNLKIMGSQPAIPIIVSITQNKAIIADILKNASLQAGKRVNIVVFPANKIIELRYKFGPYGPALSNDISQENINKSLTASAKKND